MGNGGAFFSSVFVVGVVVVCSPPLFGNESIWPGKSRHCVGKGNAEHMWEGGGLPLGSDWLYVAGSGRFLPSNYSHWVEPQTVDFYTTDLYLILLSDHNDSFSKYNQKLVTDYSFKCSILVVLFWFYSIFLCHCLNSEHSELKCSTPYCHYSVNHAPEVGVFMHTIGAQNMTNKMNHWHKSKAEWYI